MINIYTHPLITILIGLCLGSFLHALAYRIAFEKQILRKRSHCPHCDILIPWYFNIPVLAWLVLGGRCRNCKAVISWIYPFIELVTAITLTGIWHYLPLHSPLMGAAYSLFMAALIVATATDLHTFTIPQVVSIWMAPVGIAAAAAQLLHISWLQSVVGAGVGYASLWLVNVIFKKMRGIDGIGVGDMELLCMIGAFIGPVGLWHTVLVASTIGSLWGMFMYLLHKDATSIIPFGPFLALGACCHLFLARQLWYVLSLGL